MIAVLLQTRVIGALVLRETRATFGTSQIGYLWALIVPVASIAVLVSIFTFAGRHPPFGSSLALFFATGILVLQFFTKLSSSLMTVFEANKALIIYPSIKEVDVLIARFVLISATYAVIFIMVFYGIFLWDEINTSPAIDKIIEAFIVIAFMGFGFGTLNAVIISVWDSWRHIEKILISPLFFLSGIFYVPSHLPAELIALLEWNPVLQAVEWIRSGFYQNYESAILDRGYLMNVSITLILLGLAGERLSRWRRGA